MSNRRDFIKIVGVASVGALYWYLNNLKGKNIINNMDKDLILYLKSIQKQDIDIIEVAIDIAKEIESITLREKTMK